MKYFRGHTKKMVKKYEKPIHEGLRLKNNIQKPEKGTKKHTALQVL